MGVDGNSPLARRYRDLVEMMTAELGDRPGPGDVLQVRNAATLQLHAEDLTARMVRGEAVDAEEVTRAANGATRALNALRRGKGSRKAPGGGVEAYLAARAAGARQ